MANNPSDITILPSEIRNKLTQYLFLNLAYLLQKYGEHVQYGFPQYSSKETGFTIYIFRVSFETYTYASRCFEALGRKRIIRECGTTIAVLSDTPEESNAVRSRFVTLLAEAHDQLALLNGRTPQEYYALQTNPVIVSTYNTDHQHFVELQAETDDFSRVMWSEIGWGSIAENTDGDCERILVLFYKRRPRDRFVRYLRRLGDDNRDRLPFE